MPKSRWYPNKPLKENGFSMNDGIRKEMTITYPKVLLQEVNWGMHLSTGYDNIGFDGAPEWALALSASRSLDGLSDLVPRCGIKEKGWHLVHARDLGGINRWTGLDTTFDTKKPVESISVVDKQVWQVFDWLRATGHGSANGSTGWTGNLTLSVPVLNTICQYSDNTGISEGSIKVIPPNPQMLNDSSFAINFGRSGALSIHCKITFRQALFPIAMWIVQLRPVDMSFNHYSTKHDGQLTYEKPLPQDHQIARALASQIQGVLANMDKLVGDKGIARYLLLISRRILQLNPSMESDAHSLAVVVAVLIQNLIGYADQIRPEMPTEMPKDPSNTITSFPIQWQLYGSGPRLAWQWMTVFVLVTVLGCFCFGLWQTFWYWMSPGAWTEVPGMMVLAQISGDLKDIDKPEADRKLYFVDEESKGKVLLESVDCKNAK